MIGVYAVINIFNRKAYVGSSINIGKRLAQHRWSIKHKRFLNRQPYQDEAKVYGIDGFEFVVLAKTDTIEEARELETACLECLFGDDLYNKCPNADGGTGAKRDSAAYIVGAAKRVSNPDFSKKLSAACKGKREIVTCPSCGLSGGGGNMRRYHFEKCKSYANL
jgi:hypothetical protein